MDGSGQVLGGGTETLSTAANSQERPALTYDAARGRYLAVWADYRHAGSGPDVYGQLLRDYTTVVEYTYDPLSRLVAADYSSGIEFGYTYDGAGNRTQLTETTPLSGTIATTYTYDKANRLKTRGVSDGRSYTYSWSQRGELLAETTQGLDVRTFEWDAAGRLAQATVFTLTTYFTYAGDGTRVALEVEGVGVTHFIPDRGGRILEERTATTSTRYLYGYECIGEVRAGTLLYYLADGQGYVRQSTGADGAVVDAWLFTPDGGVMAGPEGPVSHLVCGGVYDWSTGLLYNGGRYFDPALGIWLALGPLVLVQGWRERKRKGRRRVPPYAALLLLALVAAGVGAMLAACGPTPSPWPTSPPQSTPMCTELPSPVPPTPMPSLTPTPPLLGGYMVFVDNVPTMDPNSKKWPEEKIPLVRRVFDVVVNSSEIGYAGGKKGFGSVDRWAAEFQISKDNPIRLIYTSGGLANGGWCGLLGGPYFPCIRIGEGRVPLAELSMAYHELAHVWDGAAYERFSPAMAAEVGARTYARADYSARAQTDLAHGTWPTRYAMTSRTEDFAESVMCYFMPSRVQDYQWSDDDGGYVDGAGNPVQPDSIMYPPDTTDRYDFVEWLFGKGASPYP